VTHQPSLYLSLSFAGTVSHSMSLARPLSASLRLSRIDSIPPPLCLSLQYQPNVPHPFSQNNARFKTQPTMHSRHAACTVPHSRKNATLHSPRSMWHRAAFPLENVVSCVLRRDASFQGMRPPALRAPTSSTSPQNATDSLRSPP